MKCIHPFPRHANVARERGTALIASLCVVASIAALGAYIVQIQTSFSKRQNQAIDRKRALYVAEAGLAESVLAVSQGKSGELGSSELPVQFHEGIYWVESEQMTDGRRMLTSRGRVGTGQFAVQVVVTPNVHQVGALGFFGDEGVVIGDGVVIDGYDARIDEYKKFKDKSFPFMTSGKDGLVRSNGDIVVDDAAPWPAGKLNPFASAFGKLPLLVQASKVWREDYGNDRKDQTKDGTAPRTSFLFGDVRPGPKGVFVTTGATRFGTLEPSNGRALLPPVIVPDTARYFPGRTTLLLAREYKDVSARFDEIVVGPLGHVTLVGPAVVHAKSLTVQSGGTLVLDDKEGPILFVVEDKLAFEPGSLLSSAQEDEYQCGTYLFMKPSPTVGDDARVTLQCGGDFRGIIYAPGDRLTLPTLLRVWGAVSAKHLTIADGAWLTYDLAFKTGGEGVPAFPQQLTWQILEEEQPTLPARFDPIRDLTARGIEPLASWNASPEVQVEFNYFDVGGTRRIYSGAKTGIDFSTVDRVIGLRWQDPESSEYSELQRPSGCDPDNLIESTRAIRRQAMLGEGVELPLPKKKVGDDD